MKLKTESQMKVPELKTFLKLCGLKVSGKKIGLISQVFSAVKNKIQVVKTAKDVEVNFQESKNLNSLSMISKYQIFFNWKQDGY